jgi:hypothetical protein
VLRYVLAIAVVALSFPVSAHAALSQIPVLRYDMPNGSGQASGGTFNYWDVTYSGGGNVFGDGAPLSGGTGKLTDQVVGTAPWLATANAAGTGPDVGWLTTLTPIPIVTFRLAPVLCLCAVSVIREITVWLDNSEIGGVAAPAEILFNGVSVPFVPPAPGGYGRVSLTGLNVVDTGTHTLRFVPQGPQFPWIFVSEVQFLGEIIVPAPGALALYALGLAGLLALRRR